MHRAVDWTALDVEREQRVRKHRSACSYALHAGMCGKTIAWLLEVQKEDHWREWSVVRSERSIDKCSQGNARESEKCPIKLSLRNGESSPVSEQFQIRWTAFAGTEGRCTGQPNRFERLSFCIISQQNKRSEQIRLTDLIRTLSNQFRIYFWRSFRLCSSDCVRAERTKFRWHPVKLAAKFSTQELRNSEYTKTIRIRLPNWIHF